MNLSGRPLRLDFTCPSGTLQKDLLPDGSEVSLEVGHGGPGGTGMGMGIGMGMGMGMGLENYCITYGTFLDNSSM